MQDYASTFQITKKTVQKTKYFVYRNKKFAFNYDLLKQNSITFYENRQIYKNVQFINILSDDEENAINISDDVIETFIECCQNQQFQINISNIMPLQYLAYKFKVTQLIDISDKYLASNWENLVLQSMLFKSQLSENLCKDIDDFHEKFYDTTREEDYLSSNINKFIEQDQLLSFSIPVLYRIFQKLENDINIEKVINFLFKCLDKFGKEASILFLNIDFKQQKNKVINTLLNDYKDVFDFNMINQTLFQTTSNLTSEVAQLREEYEHNLSQMKSFFEEQRKEFIQIKRDNLEMTKKNELIMKEKEEMLKSQLNEMKCEMKNQHDYYESEFQKLKEKHEEAINHSNFNKYMQITRILISLEKFKDFPDDLKDFVIKEIIQEQLIKINNENNTFISHVLLLKNLFDNTMNSNDLLEQVNFIKNNIDHIFINLQMIETLCQRNLLKSTLNDLIYDFDDILIEQEYKSEKYEFVSNTISDLNDTYRKKSCENSNNDDSDTNCIDTNESKIKISLIIPENTLIDQNIKNKESIYKITIPSSILAIPESSFIGCKSIRQVECDPFKTNLENAFPESQNLHLIIKLSQELETLINIDEIKGIHKFKQITIPSSIKLIN